MAQKERQTLDSYTKMGPEDSQDSRFGPGLFQTPHKSHEMVYNNA